MSDRPQTTRNKIMGIFSADHAQIMFLDTPGVHKPLHKLGEYMNQAAIGALNQVDVILFVVDACEKKGAGERFIIEHLKRVKTPVLLVINKIDKLEDKSKLLEIMSSYRDDLNFDAVVPVSALEKEGFAELQEEIVCRLPMKCPMPLRWKWTNSRNVRTVIFLSGLQFLWNGNPRKGSSSGPRAAC